MKVGVWKAFSGESVVDALKKSTACYKDVRVIECVLRDDHVVPRFMLPAGINEDWRAEVNARTRGVWR